MALITSILGVSHLIMDVLDFELEPVCIGVNGIGPNLFKVVSEL